MNFVSVCQKNSPFSVKNLEARQAKRVICRETAYVETLTSRDYKQAGPALPECPNSKTNQGETGKTYESQQASDRVHLFLPPG